MTKSIFLIRCTAFDSETKRLYDLLTSTFGSDVVFPVVDAMGESDSTLQQLLSTFPENHFPIDDDFINREGLHKFAGMTGWLCGDYALYRALEQDDWEFAWVMEPDLVFLNGALSIIEEVDQSSVDLIGYYHRSIDSKWWWHRRIFDYFPEENISMVAFPLIRASRKLVQEALKMRQEFTPYVESGALAPNDESILATVAARPHFTTRSLKDEYGEAFRYWATNVKFSLAGLERIESTPQIVHSAAQTENLISWMLQMWDGLKTGNKAKGTWLAKAAEVATQDELRQFVQQLTQKEKERIEIPSPIDSQV